MFVNSCSIQTLLNAPNPDDPLAKNTVKHWKSDEVKDVVTGLYLN
jgi:ubiquitin-protein ligase